jgi:predicted RNA-binding Zn ribbon-like protein
MTARTHEIALLLRLRDDVCLAYANTLSWRGRARPVEELGGIGDLLRWVAKSAELAGSTVAEVEHWARAEPAAADRLFAAALALREAIYRIFHAVARGDALPDWDLAALNSALAAAPPRHRLAPAPVGYGWQVGPAAISASGLLVPVLWSAADLLASERCRRVRLCANEQCLWLFLDESKTGTRRWCNMASCGNRAKARRHYRRARPRRGT